MYMLLVEADASRQPEEGAPGTTARVRPKQAKQPAARKNNQAETVHTAPAVVPKDPPKTRSATPQVVFNIQVVLPADASAETYDQIFTYCKAHLNETGGQPSKAA